MTAYAVLAAAYVLSQFYRSFLAVLTKILEADLGAGALDLSRASGAWFIAFALMQFPIGFALDRYGPRRTTSVLLAAGGAGGAALFAIAREPWHLVVAMALIGIGCAPVLMAAFFLFARNFSMARFATLGSTFVAVGTLGNVVGTRPLAAAVEAFGWREVSWGLCAITAAVGVALWFTVRDPEHVEAKAGAPGGFLAVLVHPAIVADLSVHPAWLRGCGGRTRPLGRAAAWPMSTASTPRHRHADALHGAGSFGRQPRLRSARPAARFAQAGCHDGNIVVALACAVLAFAMPQQVWVVSALLVTIGFFGASYAVQLAHGRAFIPPHLIGRGVTLMNFFSIGGVGLMQFVSGAVVEHSAVQGDPAAAYRALFLLYTLSVCGALAAYSFSRDVRPSRQG